jgi:hypothetical protein
MENNKQTAVNYLLSHIWTTDWVNYTREQKLAVIEQAKEMEKEQIAKAFDDGDYNYHYSRKTGDDFEDGKEYYNEVYG